MQFDIEKRKKAKGMREKDGKRDSLRFSAVIDFCHCVLAGMCVCLLTFVEDFYFTCFTVT